MIDDERGKVMVMPKKGLRKYAGKSLLVVGNVVEISSFQPPFGNPIPSFLVNKLFRDGDATNQLTDHIWINPACMAQYESFPEVSLGDKVRFRCYVGWYQKACHHRSHFDNTFESICDFEIVKPEPLGSWQHADRLAQDWLVAGL